MAIILPLSSHMSTTLALSVTLLLKSPGLRGSSRTTSQSQIWAKFTICLESRSLATDQSELSRSHKNTIFSICFVSSRIFSTILTFLFHFLFPPLYPTSLPSFPFHTLTSNDKTIEQDDIGTLWPSNTWWPKELLYQKLSCPKNIRRSVPHCPLPRRDPSPHQAGDSPEESLLKPMPPLPA